VYGSGFNFCGEWFDCLHLNGNFGEIFTGDSPVKSDFADGILHWSKAGRYDGVEGSSDAGEAKLEYEPDSVEGY